MCWPVGGQHKAIVMSVMGLRRRLLIPWWCDFSAFFLQENYTSDIRSIKWTSKIEELQRILTAVLESMERSRLCRSGSQICCKKETINFSSTTISGTNLIYLSLATRQLTKVVSFKKKSTVRSIGVYRCAMIVNKIG